MCPHWKGGDQSKDGKDGRAQCFGINFHIPPHLHLHRIYAGLVIPLGSVSLKYLHNLSRVDQVEYTRQDKLGNS